MVIETEAFLVGLSLILILCALVSKLTSKLGVPALLVFIGMGMLLGPAGFSIIDFDSPGLAQKIGITALILILFSGGLDTEWKDIRPYLREGALLSTIGVLLTTFFVGMAVHLILGFPLLESLLIGAIISSTDAAAVFSVFRAKSLGLRRGVRETLELESGSNDPMAVFLTIGLLKLMTEADASVTQLIFSFFQEMIVGGVVGVMAGRWMRILINKIRLEYEGLYPIITLACVFMVYGLTQKIGGNGFLAVYVAAVVLSQTTFIHRKSLMITHDSVAWMMQIAMFLCLGLFLNPIELVPVAQKGVVLGIIILFFGRPLSVFISLYFSRFRWREKLAISWLGLRGAMPIILATYPMTVMDRSDQSEMYFNLVFFVVLTSTLIQGVSLKKVARWLRVLRPVRKKARFPFDHVSMGNLRNEVTEFEVSQDSGIIGQSIAEMNIPDDFMILLIRRETEVFAPRGGTIFAPGDSLLVIGNREDSEVFRNLLGRKKSHEGEKIRFPERERSEDAQKQD